MSHLLDSPGSCRVLVVDDDRDAADSLVTMLTHWGFSAAAVYDGAEAILAHDLLQPSLMLVELGMPDVGGLEVATVIRNSCPPRPVTLVALTGRGSDADRVISACVGFDDHVCKPIGRARLHQLALVAGPARRATGAGGIGGHA